MGLQIRIEDTPLHDVALARAENRPASVWIDGAPHRAMLRAIGDAYEIRLDDRIEQIWLVADHDVVFIHAFGRAWRAEVSDPAERSASEIDQDDAVRAPMPGTVMSVAAQAGDIVAEGQPLLVIESMKMQSEIVAWRDGVVERVHLQVNDTFDRGAVLVELQPLAARDGDAP